MAQIKLKWDELQEVIDAGLIVLGYTKDASKHWKISSEDWSLTVLEKKRTSPKPKFTTKDVAFQSYKTGRSFEDKPSIEISYKPLPNLEPKRPRALFVMGLGFSIGMLAYHIFG